MMKGQFFIISTVIMVAALIMITQYMYDYGRVDLTQVEQMQELNYIEDVQNTLTRVAQVSCYKGDNFILDDNLDTFEKVHGKLTMLEFSYYTF